MSITGAGNPPLVALGVLTACISAATAIIAVFATSRLSMRREHEADWRRLKLERYQEYVLALSAVVQGRRVTPEAHARYADALNAMSLIAPIGVLEALDAFQKEITGQTRQDTEHDRLLSLLFTEMRSDVRPGRKESGTYKFILRTVPPKLGAPPQDRPDSHCTPAPRYRRRRCAR